jgi:hypothetical protein
LSARDGTGCEPDSAGGPAAANWGVVFEPLRPFVRGVGTVIGVVVVFAEIGRSGGNRMIRLLLSIRG